MPKEIESGKGGRKPSFADEFYRSHEWRRCRKAYASKAIYCERCLKRGLTVPGTEVHHKIRLTPENLKDPSVSMNWENLELLCDECHREEHAKRRWRADEYGHIMLPPSEK